MENKKFSDQTPVYAITAVNGNNRQSTIAGSAFPQRLDCITENYNLGPVGGVQVVFSCQTNDIYFASPNIGNGFTAWSDSSGYVVGPIVHAREGSVGPFHCHVGLAGNDGPGDNTFVLTSTAAPVYSLSPLSGSNQSAEESTTFPNSLTCVVGDAQLNAVPNAPVTFTVTGPATFDPRDAATVKPDCLSATIASDARGMAHSPLVVAGSVAGQATVTATNPYQQAPATFLLFVTPPAPVDPYTKPYTLVKSAGDHQSTTTGQDFSNPLQTLVLDASGKQVANATVSYSINGPATFDPGDTTSRSDLTDGNGIATSSKIKAGGSAGTVQVIAANKDATSQATFDLSITVPSYSDQITPLGQKSISAPRSGTRDMFFLVDTPDTWEAIAGAQITMTLSNAGSRASFSSSSSVLSTSATADPSGVVGCTIHTGPDTGTATVTASTPGGQAAPSSVTLMID